jgi:hypothetical protein
MLIDPELSDEAKVFRQAVCDGAAAPAAASGGGGAGRSKSHSLLGQAMTGPALRFFSTRYSLPQLGHFSAIGLPAEVNLHLG